MADHEGEKSTLTDKLTLLHEHWVKYESFVKRLVQNMTQKGLRLIADPETFAKPIDFYLQEAIGQAQSTVHLMQQLQDLIQESAVITSTLELDQVLQRIIDTVITLTHAQRAYLMLREPGKDDLTVRIAHNIDYERMEASQVSFSHRVVQMALQEAKPIITTNAKLDERLQSAESVVNMHLMLIVCLPLLFQGQALGVLYADSPIEHGAFSNDMLPMLAAFATQAAIAIKNASAFTEVKDNLAQALREMHELRIQIDEERVKQEVSSITESEYFQSLAARAEVMRAKRAAPKA